MLLLLLLLVRVLLLILVCRVVQIVRARLDYTVGLL